MGILRVVLAALVSPLLAGLLLTFPLWAFFIYSGAGASTFGLLPTILGAAALMGYPMMFLLGIPYFLLSLKLTKLLSIWSYAMAGGILANLGSFLAFSKYEFEDNWFLTLGGVITAIIFWLIAKPRKFKTQESLPHAQTH